MASRGAAVAAGVLIIGTLLPWVSVTFFSAATLNGVRIWEGRLAMVLAVAAGALALASLLLEEVDRRALLLASGLCGALAFIATAVFGFRFRDALNVPSVLGDTQAGVLARAGAGLDAGWYLSMASGIVLTALAVWGYMSMRGNRPSEAVPGMEWVEPGTHQGSSPGAGTTSQSTGQSTGRQGPSPGDRG
ncbi:hypothetical protein ABGB12_06280 [Actinocorallia sp. B10E7]|uniref:hypothetical protein n=1 Tax=Actinocorallia sp. B10E7 TaxID=3153558 RepID=UPI00325D49D8